MKKKDEHSRGVQKGRKEKRKMDAESEEGETELCKEWKMKMEK